MMPYIFLAIILSVCTCVSGYPQGTPDIACYSMFPIGHKVPAQNSTSNYTITISAANYTCGESVTVTLGGTMAFKGFFCQARTDVMNGTSRVGIIEPINANISQPRCDEKAITHTSSFGKSSISFTWTPTANYGNVRIVCTFVKKFDTYWIRQPSMVMTYQSGGFCSAGSMTSAFVGAILSCLALFMFI